MNEICKCGKIHKSSVDTVIAETGAIKYIPSEIKKYGAKKVFVLADVNTYKAAGEKICALLDENGISYSKYIFTSTALEPDETAVGAAVMHYDSECDLVLGVGSGVINDIGKILSKLTKTPYIIAATAPSMDGYASASSSMAMDGLKVTLATKCPNVIIGDIDILKNAPIRMLQSGLGDMLAKYISICEWRIAQLLVGEYYCEEVAALVRSALKKCTDNAEGLLKRDEAAVKAVFEGLVIGGRAMEYAGLSRPASGVEHYISHIWDMRGLAFGTTVDFHGIQCAIGTLAAAKIYEQVKTYTPNREKALKYAKEFDVEEWRNALAEFVGDGAEAMIELDKKEQKYDVRSHGERLEKIIGHWDEILAIIEEEVPSAKAIEELLDLIGAPKTCEEIGIDSSLMPMTFKASKDIRDKYVLSRLCWDLGILDELVIK